MLDKEVGELWRTREQHFRMTGCTSCLDLIRKLVEERAMRFYSGGTAGLYKALRDFGIDPEDWK